MFNLFKKTEDVPRWFQSDIEDYRYFRRTVEKVRKEKFSQYSFSADKSSLLTLKNGKEALRLNLINMAQVCLQSNKQEWEDIVIKFLSSTNSNSFNEKDNFNEVESTIAIQLYPKELLNQTKIPFLYKEVIPETIIVLVFDAPDRIEFIKPHTLEIWKKSADELFVIALKNTKKMFNDLPFQPLGNGSRVYIGESENALTACASLSLKDISKLYNEKGIIFSCPNRHTVLALEITNLDTVSKELPLFSGFTQQIFSTSPYPINPNIYWVREGHYIKLQYEIVGSEFNFSPPQEFLDLW